LGSVYDLTQYRHPAGNSYIRRIAGTDGTEDFLDEHRSSFISKIEGFKVGSLLDGQGGGVGPPPEEFPGDDEEDSDEEYSEDSEDNEKEESDELWWD
jgi:hypothetical protein